MTKKECSKLQVEALTIMETVAHAIKGLTEENPLVLFDAKKINCDEIYDFPYGYTVGRHGDYLQGNVQKVCGNDVLLFLTGDDYGQTLELELEQLPFESLVQLLSYIEKTLKD